MMNNAQRTPLLDVAELVVERHGFTEDMAIKSQDGALIGSASKSGNKLLRIFNEMTPLFPLRPFEVVDADGRPELLIENRGLLRRSVVTVREPGHNILGKLVGKSLPGLRYTGYWVEIDGDRCGELLVEKRGYRVLDTAGADVAHIAKRGGDKHGIAVPRHTPLRTTLQTRQRLSTPFMGLAIAATILLHEGV